MPIQTLFKVKQADRHNFCVNVIESSSPRADFYFLVILSTLIVALGLLADNLILVIGGMLVTPLLSPILAMSLGILINEPKVIIRSLKILGLSFVYAFFIAFFLGIFTSVKVSDISIINIMQPSLFTFFVAVVAGVAASYTWVKPGLDSTLPGIAITVTLIPPLTAVGLAVASRDWFVFSNVIKVLLLNMFGIAVASLVVFSFMEFYKSKKKIVQEVNEEEKELAKEKKEIERKNNNSK
jgi:uncharacterized hydrophobic protein (TIGR00271 family)